MTTCRCKQCRGEHPHPDSHTGLKLSIGGVLIGVGMHFFCCILPAVLILTNTLLGTSLVLKFSLFDHDAAEIMLYVSGFFVILSLILHRRAKNVSKRERIILYVTTGVYFLSLGLHFFEHI